MRLKNNVRPLVLMRIIFCLLVLLAGVLYAGDTNAPSRSSDITVIGWSPLQTFYIEQHVVTPNEVRQVWLVSSKNSKDRRLLYTHSRSIEVFFSDDEHWLVINDYAGSNIANVLLFRQRKGLDYKQVEDITDKAWQFVAIKMGRKKRPDFDHEYAEALRWTDDHTILLCLHGHTDRRNFIDDWLCLYDVNSNTFSTDLDKQNKQHTTLKAEP